MKIARHYLGLGLVMLLGTALRFWNLDFKPLWLDEVITALFTAGHNYHDVPLETWLPIASIEEIFTFNPSTTCPQIAHTLATESTHPPLFFCLINGWLQILSHGKASQSLAFSLRSLPVLFGVGAIASIYYLTRIAFSQRAGLIAATVMAVSPFGIYLSQEARHYTLPILLITLSLIGLIQIQQDIQKNHLRKLVLLAWIAINSIGFYVHYFFILAFIAQIATLGLFLYQTKPPKFSHYLLPLTACLLPFIFFIPWIPVLVGDSNSPDTNWLPQPHNIAPIYQTLVAWLLMVIALPVENQPLWLAIPAAILMLLFGIYLGREIYQSIKQLWQTHQETKTLLYFSLCVLLQLFAIVYLMGKDLTVAPRYHFIYYPAFCALIGASLSQKKFEKRALNPLISLVLIGIFSSILVVHSWVFQKPYNPQKVAKDMNVNSEIPLVIVMGYNDNQDIALGLSFGLAIDKNRQGKSANNYLAFLERSPQYESVWQTLSQMPSINLSKFNLWVVAPGLRRIDYPAKLSLSNTTNCDKDEQEYHRLGIPYQLYRCAK